MPRTVRVSLWVLPLRGRTSAGSAIALVKLQAHTDPPHLELQLRIRGVPVVGELRRGGAQRRILCGSHYGMRGGAKIREQVLRAEHHVLRHQPLRPATADEAN